MDFKALFSKEKGKELGVAGLKSSVPAAAAVAILSGVSVYLGFEIPSEGIVSMFFSAQLGNLCGQFQKNPRETVRRFTGLFSGMKDG